MDVDVGSWMSGADEWCGSLVFGSEEFTLEAEVTLRKQGKEGKEAEASVIVQKGKTYGSS